MPPLPAYDSQRVNSSSRPTHIWIFAIFAAVLLLIVILFSGLERLPISSNFRQKTPSLGTMTHDAAGWHARSPPFEGSFEPAPTDVVLLGLVNSPVEAQGFTVALVEPNLAVDAAGKVLVVAAEDFAAIRKLAKAVGKLPSTGLFGGQWRVKHDRTCYPIDRLLVAGQAEVSVYGWDKDTDVLESKVGEFEKLPEELQTVILWFREARDDYVSGTKDEEPIRKVLHAAAASGQFGEV